MVRKKRPPEPIPATFKLKRSGSIRESTESKATAITNAGLDVRPTSATKKVAERINRNKIGLAIGLSILGLTAIVLAYQLIQALRQRLPNQTQRALSRLTFDVGLQSRPTWSPDGRFSAYSADELQSIAKSIKASSAILDGEIVAVDESGTQCFEQLQNHRRDCFIIYFAFDLIFLNGESLVEVSLMERKAQLKRILPKSMGRAN